MFENNMLKPITYTVANLRLNQITLMISLTIFKNLILLLVLSKSIIKKRAKILRNLGELILNKVKSKLSLPREILIEELNSGLAIGYDQNYIKHKVPLVGVPIGEVIRI